MGIGCRRDPLEANVWYVKAADHGDDRAKQRLKVIQAAASGGHYVPSPVTSPVGSTKLKKSGSGKDSASATGSGGSGHGKEKDENCVVM